MLIKKLYDMGAKNVILTGESFTEGKTGFIYYDGKELVDYAHDRIAGGCHGTGDIYASAFTGALINGKDAYTSAKIAADFVVEAIKCSQFDPDHKYGARFEPVLCKLNEMLKG
jgi:pyridoxine kinase